MSAELQEGARMRSEAAIRAAYSRSKGIDVTPAIVKVNRSIYLPVARKLVLAVTGLAYWLWLPITTTRVPVHLVDIQLVASTVPATSSFPGGSVPLALREENYHATAVGTSAHSQHNR